MKKKKKKKKEKRKNANMSIPIRLFDGDVILNINRTPITFDEATYTLYNRAITNPSSLTDEERRIITCRPLLEEVDALCRGRCGQRLSGLVKKAIEMETL
jgi:hypothetical protein